jgi:hypothetical protein
MTATRALLQSSKKIENNAQVQQVSSAHYFNLQKNLLSEICCLLRELTLMKLPLRNINWAHISGRRNSELLRVNPFCYIVNAGGGTRGDSEFRRPEMWALVRALSTEETHKNFFTEGP